MAEINKNKRVWTFGIIGLFLGIVLSVLLIVAIMPKMMIVTKESRFGFDDTVSLIQQNITKEGWSVKGVSDVTHEINKGGYEFKPKIKIIKLCKAEYAKEVLTTDRFVSCLMPCSISVWEDDDGKVHVSEMNMALMAKLFGGNIAKVMGGKVVSDEERMLEGILKN